MNWLSWRMRPEVWLALAVAALAGACEPSNAVKPGPPVLLSMTVNDQGSGSPYELTGDAGPIAVPGYVHVTAIFDRLLDPTDFNPDPDGGLRSIYTPNGSAAPSPFGLLPGPNVVVGCDPTFPSGASIVVTLIQSKLHSKAGEPFTGEGDLAQGRLSFQTQPFGVTITPPDGTDAKASVSVVFNNVPGADAPSHITVTAGGQAVTDAVVKLDPSKDPPNPTMFTVAPADSWPAGVDIVVTVDSGAQDVFGAPLAAAASATFMIPAQVDGSTNVDGSTDN
jgi:hypothetical protein